MEKKKVVKKKKDKKEKKEIFNGFYRTTGDVLILGVSKEKIHLRP